jgi:tRNA nucleotidyltransferase (CCA-adding enzyme)
MSQYIESGKKILHQLTLNGFEAFFVGGFVRDYVLHIPANDIDITTSATPDQIKTLFEKTKDTGLKYGTVTVFQDNLAFEVTTYRLDGIYLDSRRPENVEFSNVLEDDLVRRDFTINAMAMTENGHVIDLVGAKADLADQVIRAIGNPNERFKEDALRILRAFRFVSKLGFDIEEHTFLAMKQDRFLLDTLPSERLLQEFKAIFQYNYQDKTLSLMAECRLHEVFTELENAIKLLSGQTGYQIDMIQFFALAFYLSGHEIPSRWRFSNKEKAIIEKLMALLFVTSDDQFNEMIVYTYGLDVCLLADQLNRLINPLNQQTQRIVDLYQQMPIHKTCDLAFKGDHILQLGLLDDARIIGDIIDDLTYQVITLQIPNEFTRLKEYTLTRWINPLIKKDSLHE